MSPTKWIDKLKVPELKDELKKRGLPISGKKAELAQRLIEHVSQEEQTNAADEGPSAQGKDAEHIAEPSAAASPPGSEDKDIDIDGVQANENPPSTQNTAPDHQTGRDGAMNDRKEQKGFVQNATEKYATVVAGGFGLIPTKERGKDASEAVNNKHMDEDKDQGQSKDQSRKRPAKEEAQTHTQGHKKVATPSKKHAVASKNDNKNNRNAPLTMADITKDDLTRLATETWSRQIVESENAPAFSVDMVNKIYREELGGGSENPPPRKIALLELSQYLENYLWRGYDPKNTADRKAHIISIILMVNEKMREGLAAWTCFQDRPDDFASLFKEIVELRKHSSNLTYIERLSHLDFLSNAFQSLENELLRVHVLRLVSLPLWHSLSLGRLQLELHKQPKLAKHWKNLAKKEAKGHLAHGDAHISAKQSLGATFIPSLLEDFLEELAGCTSSLSGENQSNARSSAIKYCEKFVWFLSNLLSQLPTRRFLHAVVEDKAILVKCHLSPLYKHPDGVLFARLVAGLASNLSFPIDDHTGDAESEDAVTAAHYDRVQQLQRLLFKHWPKLKDVALSSCGTVEKREYLAKFLNQLSPEELQLLVTRQLRLVDAADSSASDPQFLIEVMIQSYERRRPQREIIESMPLYPTEELLCDGDAVPDDKHGGSSLGDGILALPRLNLQFLTLTDYFVRNFYLFRLEAAFEVREDVADAIKRTAPYLGDDNAIHYGGWSKMSHPLNKFNIVNIRKPRVGESCPASVTAQITIDTRSMRPDVASEWDALKQHDVVFLISISPPDVSPFHQNSIDWSGPTNVALKAAGLQHVRGCEVLEIRDQDGKLMNDFTGRVPPEEQGMAPRGTIRTITVAVDPQQYHIDAATGKDVYSSFNLVMRRNAKENNFKAILESIRDLVSDENSSGAIPLWLQDVILGYGDPKDALYPSMDEKCLHTIDFKDTFLDAEHVKECFESKYTVEFKTNNETTTSSDTLLPPPPYKITFPSFSPTQEDTDDAETTASPSRPSITVESYQASNPGPYPEDVPPQNTVRFTPIQTEAILSGVQPGLTMVVGPPGTGKTDTAVQILHMLYHNFPNQRTLIITHSNQALNDLFQKIVERDVPPRYLLRLGMGEADLDTEEQFSRVGRVNAMLLRRLQLLAEVERLATSLKLPESAGYTCETAGHFWLLHVLSRWEKFSAAVRRQQATPKIVSELFPFKEFFSDAPGRLFTESHFETDWAKAEGCFRHLQIIFKELEEVRPFEILKTQADRINYLLTKQAKIVAMTCTHAALKRKEFLELGFTYDNLLMEEAAQILEIETALPMLLQKGEDNGESRLKRVVLIGDHNQLPPVVKNTALQKFSRMDQSLFSRLIRLGTPYIELNAQGRARPSIAALYNWRYRNLGDLPRVANTPAFLAANPGFAFEYQLIDVPDFLGKGESEPLPYFYQNLGEAEYVVSVYQYMRLLGYPAASISILTTYNGQRALLHDVIERRCASHPLFGRPRTVSTVDKYQGQQNDYVLLSLVRTKHFGHLRDVRRLVVAMSRARLGLYVFARAGLFANCFELQATFRQLLSRPTTLALVAGEKVSDENKAEGQKMRRPVTEAPLDALLVQGVEHMASIVERMGTEWEMNARAE